MSLGENVRRLRQANGWTQEELADKAGLRMQHISRIEQDDGDPRLSTLEKLWKGLECSPNALLLTPKPRDGDAILLLLLERLTGLTRNQQADLVPMLDRYCNACEMENTMSRTQRMLEQIPTTQTAEAKE